MSTARRPLDLLRSTITCHLPAEFKRPHHEYEFDFIESKAHAEALVRRRARGTTEDASYNFLRLVDPSWTAALIQVPTIIRNAHYESRSRFEDHNVSEFLLTALMIRPRVDGLPIEGVESGLRLIHEQVEPESLSGRAPFDRHAITRLTMALCRLGQNPSLDEAAFRNGEHRFLELYREFCDLRGSVFRPGEPTWGPTPVKTFYLDARLAPKTSTSSAL